MAAKSQARLCTPPPPTCPPPQPAQESRVMQCPAPLVGNWTQTRSYSCSAPNWVAGEWLPAVPPDGVCAQPPPPTTFPPRIPAQIQVTTVFDLCEVGMNLYSGTQPIWIEAQKFGSTEIIRGGDNVPRLRCSELGMTEPQQIVLWKFRAVNSAGPSPWTGYWPLLLFSPWDTQEFEADPDYQENIDYTIRKPRTENFSFGCPAP
jgi:hypothetical protein